MRVPTLHRKPVWQRFFAGVVIGGCISWMIFLFMYGTLQEKQSIVIKRQNSIIKDLRDEKKIWQDEWDKLTKKNAEMLIVQNVSVKINRYEKYGIKDSHSIFEKEEEIKEDLRSLIAKDISEVYQNKDLIFKTIENKTLKINNRRYKLVIKDILFYSTINIYLELKLAD
ncbi:sporulation protein [Heyndrickxia shackletonii]|uniref:Sporulation protein n=1 Tax=Heyndrickxia shackletonii TaxID=157838 RepID=A0A0Q3WWH2_9BACI|nr:sporulation membrane protein YtrI [Heyndrickxia shackletonii]KQL53309.1 sporulation protein [Heyndrickxia shackletonii]MBB2480266.1 sporulation protein [Bacillus sp. APMAM]NEZ01282.1 sporulation protein [Heyndrickxia shackletonii]RTZ56313.1 sporulation protein [Bacillus sp. SAJ1]